MSENIKEIIRENDNVLTILIYQRGYSKKRIGLKRKIVKELFKTFGSMNIYH